MSVIDTKLNNLNIWEGTTAQVESAYEQELIGENDLVFITDETPTGSFEDKFRYSTMPFATEDWAGKIVQYIGGTNGTYVEGGFYKCVAIEPHIDTVSSGIGLTLSFIASTGIDTFESFCEDNDSDCAYMEITGFNSPYSPTRCIVTSYTASGTTGSYTNSGANFTEIIPEMGLAYSNDGRIGTSDKFRVYRLSYRWELIEFANTVGFSGITGNPRDNSALDEELDSIATQVTTLPEITEDNKDRIYQYVGEEDAEHGLYKGTFYQAVNYTWEVDSADSQLIQDMSLVIRDEANCFNCLSVNRIFSQYSVDTFYFDIVFYGSDDGYNGYMTKWYLDPEYSSEVYWIASLRDVSTNASIDFGGTPTINDRASDGRDTVNTRFRLVFNKTTSLAGYKWVPINLYPKIVLDTNQALINKSHYSHSIIEKRSGDNANSDGDYNTVIGVGSNGRSSGYSTVYGADNWGNYLSTVVGAHNRNIASASIVIGANTRGTSGEYGICIGVDSGAGERAVAIGPSAQSYFRSVAIGQNANASQSYDIAIGDTTTASGTWSLAIGNEARSTAYAAVALGHRAKATAQYAVQICEGTNAATGSLQFRNYVLVENDGTIPVPRLSSTSPQDGYVLTYDEENGMAIWTSVLPDIPVTQETVMPQATAGRTVQYIGDSDGTYVEGYFYKATYNSQDDVYYWRQIDTQPSGGTISYDSLDDKPSISGVTIEGDLDLVDDFGLARVATTGSYADLSTKPGINGHPLLVNTPASTLEISYNDLVDKPANLLPNLPQDADQYDYMLKWDHTAGELVWIRATDTEEDLGTLPEPTNN